MGHSMQPAYLAIPALLTYERAVCPAYLLCFYLRKFYIYEFTHPSVDAQASDPRHSSPTAGAQSARSLSARTFAWYTRASASASSAQQLRRNQVPFPSTLGSEPHDHVPSLALPMDHRSTLPWIKHARPRAAHCRFILSWHGRLVLKNVGCPVGTL